METQTLLVVIIALLSVNLIFVGFYIVLILREVRGSVTKMNKFLDTVNEVSGAVASPIVGASDAISAFTQGVKVFNMLKRVREKKDAGVKEEVAKNE